MARGGPRNGAGRPRLTAATVDEAVTALECLLGQIRRHWRSNRVELARQLFRDASRLHRRLLSSAAAQAPQHSPQPASAVFETVRPYPGMVAPGRGAIAPRPERAGGPGRP
jgi:hypothetical protein